MAEQLATLRWAYRGLYLLLAAAIFFFKLLPISSLPLGIPGPDVMLCITLAWVMRRPDYLPAALIAAVYLLEDLLFMRPPGLWAFAVLLGSEFLRSRMALLREVSFAMEWIMVATVLVAMGLLNRLVLTLAMVPLVGLGPAVAQIGMTILAYPLVVALSGWAFGMRKPATGEVDALGRRL
ncbi:rod shape-determining protein MreD [Plastorhodobacter daqingensis]|uniref:Rod shape-determining protein MreD n=1 Tax=Plastorhodobacter daqingensis TaxID=1387281 RepID=A0ABW2UEY3_9RHOB